MNINQLLHIESKEYELGLAEPSQVPPEIHSKIQSETPFEIKSYCVLMLRVQSPFEWKWVHYVHERGGQTCLTDQIAKNICLHIKEILHTEGIKSEIIPYPGPGHLSFKKLALLTGLGSQGYSEIFLHHRYGKWTHLRIMILDSPLDASPVNKEYVACIDCRQCIKNCPSGAVTVNGHDPLVCSDYMIKTRPLMQTDHRWKCNTCIEVCPAGATVQNR